MFSFRTVAALYAVAGPRRLAPDPDMFQELLQLDINWFAYSHGPRLSQIIASKGVFVPGSTSTLV